MTRNMSTRFGRIICDDEVEDELISTTKRFVLDYLAEVERQRGIAPRALRAPFAVISETLLRQQSESALPCIAIAAMSGDDTPVGEQGLNGASFLVRVTIHVDGSGELDTRTRVMAMTAAVRALARAQFRCGELVQDVGSIQTEYTQIEDIQGSRKIGAGILTFTVSVAETGKKWRGGINEPAEDPYSPPADLVEIQSVVASVGPLTE